MQNQPAPYHAGDHDLAWDTATGDVELAEMYGKNYTTGISELNEFVQGDYDVLLWIEDS